MTPIDDRVAAGSAWLDANRPGWWQRINLDTLDLGDPCRCVLGQEYGRYEDAPVGARFTDTDAYVAIDQGFNRDAGEMSADLTAAWRHLIQARRDAEDPWAHWADEPDDQPAPVVWPDRTHDGQRDRDTDTADVDRGIL